MIRNMKKITIIVLFVFPAITWGQSISLENIDLERILSCEETDAVCLAELETTRALVLALITQIVAIQMAEQLTVDIDPDAYWLTNEYADELLTDPLRSGRSKTFRLHDGEIRNLDESDHAVYREVWRIFSTILKPDQLELFDKIKFYNSSRDHYAALVYQQIKSRNGRETEEWELHVNLENVSFKTDQSYNDAIETLAHEAGHFLLMNGQQVEFFVDEEDCDSYYIIELGSCARDGSYYDALRPYWDQDFINWGHHYLELFRDDTDRASDQLAAYYLEHYDEHVSQYAASGPDEDAAETIAHFARYRVPTGTLEVFEEKVILLYDFEEMVEFRTRVRGLLRM